MTNQSSRFLNLDTLQILEDIDKGESVPLEKFAKQIECVNLLLEHGWLKNKNSKVYLSKKGKEKLLLFNIILELDSKEKLYEIFKNQIYERFQLLVRKDLTADFFEQIDNIELDELDSIYICSPWVGLTEDQLKVLFNLKKNGIAISIIIRPVEGEKNNILDTHNFFIKNNFNLSYYKTKPKLHTKLYIIKKNNYKNIAIFGSENLTNAKNEELGMIIRDRDFIEELEDYFLELKGNSKKSKDDL